MLSPSDDAPAARIYAETRSNVYCSRSRSPIWIHLIVSESANTPGVVDAKKAATESIAIDFRKRLPALDGLRGMAILAVFFYHYAGGLPDRVPSGPLHLLGMVFAFGWSGVD